MARVVDLYCVLRFEAVNQVACALILVVCPATVVLRVFVATAIAESEVALIVLICVMSACAAESPVSVSFVGSQ